MGNKPKYSIVVPVYNEGKTITQSLDSIIGYIAKHEEVNFELIVVDDGSEDCSLELTREKLAPTTSFEVHILQNNQNRGKGYSVRKGVLAASGDYILFTDADLSTPIEELDNLKRYFNEYDVIIGSRDIKESKVLLVQPVTRRISGLLFRQIRKLLMFPRLIHIRDTQCGFKCFKKEAALDLFSRQRLDDYTFDVEVLYLANKFGYKIIELPVVWINNTNSKVNLLRDSCKMLLNLFAIRINDWRGNYNK